MRFRLFDVMQVSNYRVLKPEKVIGEVEQDGVKMGWKKIYVFCIKFLCPIAIAVILLYSMITGTTVS